MTSNPHPLEGQYIIYKYGEQDSVDEGWALALFRLENGKMNPVYHPRNHVLEASGMGAHNIEQLLDLMQKRNVRKVFTVYHINDFFGIPSRWFSLSEQPSPVVDEWAEYNALHSYDEEFNLLTEKGINVEFYDATKE